MIQFSQETVNKEGTLIEANVTYSVNVTIVNSKLQRLACTIMKQKSEDEPMIHIGNITSENGRQVTEINQGEDLIPHLTVFNKILEEVQSQRKTDE